MIPTTRPAKSHYSEAEAAQTLGVSLEQLRTLVRANIVQSDEDMANLANAGFQPSDLLILRMILGGFTPPQAPPILEPMLIANPSNPSTHSE